MQVINNYQQSGHQKVSDTITEESFWEIESTSDSGDPMDESMGGVKVLSEITGNDENFQNDNKWFGYPWSADPISARHPFCI